MKKYINRFIVLAVLLISTIPFSASAATVYLEASKNSIAVGDTAIVTVKINAQGATINTVDGNILLKSSTNSLTVKEFSLANSAFGLWPRTPSLSSDGKIISFVGGVPGGFNIEGATLFKIIVEAKKEGSITISPQDVTAYANDGKGTKLPVQLTNVIINVGPKKTGTVTNDEWKSVVSGDTIPPEDFIVVLGQDKTLFEGKKFAFFSALDNQTGISYYEVSENGAPAVRSGSTYILQNQDGNTNLEVTAFDKAGNKKLAKYSSKTSVLSNISWQTVGITVLVLVIIAVLYRGLRKSKKNASVPL